MWFVVHVWFIMTSVSFVVFSELFCSELLNFVALRRLATEPVGFKSSRLRVLLILVSVLAKNKIENILPLIVSAAHAIHDAVVAQNSLF